MSDLSAARGSGLPAEPPQVVALGGGHGLHANLQALRLLTDRLTAVVTVADDGGSSGRLRAELGGLPPGDLRMALAALCDDSEWGRQWSALLQYRFSTDGPLDHHPVGNLLICGLWELLGDEVAGLDLVGKLLDARGRVLPMAMVPLQVEAAVREPNGQIHSVLGQKNVATTQADIIDLQIVPPDPPVSDEVVSVIENADWVILGPGSWFTSVMVHLLVPKLYETLFYTTARRCVTLNIAAELETNGYGAVEHLEALYYYAPDLRIDVVIADQSSIDDVAAVSKAAQHLGAELVVRDVAVGDGTARHDPLRLAAAYRDVFGT